VTIREYVKKTLQVPLRRFSTIVQDAMLEIIVEAIEELHLNISLLPSILTPTKSRLDILDVIAESYGYSIDPDADIIEQFNIISHLAYINKLRGSIYSIENMHEFYGGSKPEYVKVEIPSYKIFRYSVSQYSVDHVYQDNRQHRTGVYNLYLRDQDVDLAELQEFMYKELVASGSRIFFMNNITQTQKYSVLSTEDHTIARKLLTNPSNNLYCCVTDTQGNTVSKLVDERDYIVIGTSSQNQYLYIDLYSDSGVESSTTVTITPDTEDVHVEILEDHTSEWVPFYGTTLPLNCNVAIYNKKTSGTTITHIGRTLSRGWKIRSLLSRYDKDTSLRLNTMYESSESPVDVPVIEGKPIQEVVTSPVGGTFYRYGESTYFYDSGSTPPRFFDIADGVSWLPHWTDFESPDLRYLPTQIVPTSLVTESNFPVTLTVYTPCLYVRTYLRGKDIPLDSIESIEYRVSQSSGDVVEGSVPSLLTIPATCTKVSKRDQYSTEVLEHVIKFSD